jgi:hypothetical protein
MAFSAHKMRIPPSTPPLTLNATTVLKYDHVNNNFVTPLVSINFFFFYKYIIHLTLMLFVLDVYSS